MCSFAAEKSQYLSAVSIARERMTAETAVEIIEGNDFQSLETCLAAGRARKLRVGHGYCRQEGLVQLDRDLC